VQAQDKRIAALEAEIKSNLTHPLTADKTQNITQTPNSRTPTPTNPPTSGASTIPVAQHRPPLLPELSERTRVHLSPNSNFPALPKPVQSIAQPNQTPNPWKVINSKRPQAIKVKPMPAQTNAMQKPTKLVSALVIPSYREGDNLLRNNGQEPPHELATIAWKHVNQALVDLKDIKAPPFFAARFSRNSNLVLKTGSNHNLADVQLTSTNAGPNLCRIMR
jgi:hypothetical protein